MKSLAFLLRLPVKAKDVDGFVVQELKVNSQNCVRRKVKTFEAFYSQKDFLASLGIILEQR